MAFPLRPFVITVVMLAGCAAHPYRSMPADSAPTPFAANSAEHTPPQVGTGLGVSAESPNASDQARLNALWQQRTQEHTPLDFPIGPGDLLEINVGAVEELNNRTVRVSGQGTITLPFIGVVQASGLTEEELREELRRKSEQFMYNPHLSLFVREYRSRQVAVIGAVEKPGLYNLASEADTILDVLSLAGGMKEEAAPRLQFIPGEPVKGHELKEVASILPASLVNQAPVPLIFKNADPILIDLAPTRSRDQRALTLPVRPGDVIIVPSSGEVLVEGWVTKPGSYKITPGLTVHGAVVAAGGPLFAADTSMVRVTRVSEQGEKSSFFTDLKNLKPGEGSQSPVQAGDIIELTASAPKLVPYGFYSFLVSVLHMGVSAPLF